VSETAQVELISGRVCAPAVDPTPGAGAHFAQLDPRRDRRHQPVTRGLHSSSFRPNVSTFWGIRWVHHFPPVYQTLGHVEV